MNDFPKEEFISRIEKIQIHIEKENIDAVIINETELRHEMRNKNDETKILYHKLEKNFNSISIFIFDLQY